MRRGSASWRVTACLLALVALMVVAIWGLTHRSGPKTATLEAHGQVLGSIPLFRSQPEQVPTIIQKIVRRGKDDLEARKAQRLPIPHANIWAIPGSGIVCLFSKTGPNVVGSTCAGSRDIGTHGLSIVLLTEATGQKPSQRLIVGLTPAGVQEVIAVSDRAATRIQVNNGVFVSRDQIGEPPNTFTLVS